MYTENAPTFFENPDDAWRVLQAADYLELPGLVARVTPVALRTLTVENALRNLEFVARIAHHDDLACKVVKFVLCHFAEVTRQVDQLAAFTARFTLVASMLVNANNNSATDNQIEEIARTLREPIEHVHHGARDHTPEFEGSLSSSSMSSSRSARPGDRTPESEGSLSSSSRSSSSSAQAKGEAQDFSNLLELNC